MDSNHRPSGYEPDELPLLHPAAGRKGGSVGPGPGLLSHPRERAVSSALGRFTAVFGKGTGGTTPRQEPRPALPPVVRRKEEGGQGLTGERVASHSALGAARLHVLPRFDRRSINQLVLLGPYPLRVGGDSSWSVLRA